MGDAPLISAADLFHLFEACSSQEPVLFRPVHSDLGRRAAGGQGPPMGGDGAESRERAPTRKQDSHGQDLALTVLFVPRWFDSGLVTLKRSRLSLISDCFSPVNRRAETSNGRRW